MLGLPAKLAIEARCQKVHARVAMSEWPQESKVNNPGAWPASDLKQLARDCFPEPVHHTMKVMRDIATEGLCTMISPHLLASNAAMEGLCTLQFAAAMTAVCHAARRRALTCHLRSQLRPRTGNPNSV